MILPRSGSTACVRRSRPCLAEPPAESPSTRNSSRYCGSRARHAPPLGRGRLVAPPGPARAEPLAAVVARDAPLEILQEAVGLRVVRDRARHRRAEAGQVRAPLARVDVVGEGKHALLIAIVVLQRHLDLNLALLALEEQHLRVDRRLVLVEVLDELEDAAPVEKRVAP